MTSMTTTPTPTVPETEAPPRTSSGDGDHDRFAHYVPRDELTRALVEGVEVTALCGKRWVPHRDPARYRVCPTCEELRAQADA